ncbi:response regulator transcription factor [Commensalibacter intestini]|nr:response regulator transcription factor [Commensalibacter intestini]
MHVLLMGEIFFSEHEFYQELKAAGFSIDRVPYDTQLLSASRFYDYDMLIIEPDILDKQFFSTIKFLRSLSEKLPMLVVSKKNDLDLKVQSFQVGVDDFVAIPFAMQELLARCKALLRRANKVVADRIVKAGPLQINLETREVSVNNNMVRLTAKEYAILEMLILRRGVLISKTTILNYLYADSDDEPDMKIIDVFVCKLRKKLQNAGAGDLISTMWGQGYIFHNTHSASSKEEA